VFTARYGINICVIQAALNNYFQDFYGKNIIQQEEESFPNKFDVNLRKKTVNCYICSIALCGAENWTLRNGDEKYLKV
jgi:hypothetical protein